jgi:hypothetical protein
MEHGGLRLGVQDETGGVGLGVAADDQNLLAKLNERRERVLRGGGLADAALAVKRDLPQFTHSAYLVGSRRLMFGEAAEPASLHFKQVLCQARWFLDYHDKTVSYMARALRRHRKGSVCGFRQWPTSVSERGRAPTDALCLKRWTDLLWMADFDPTATELVGGMSSAVVTALRSASEKGPTQGRPGCACPQPKTATAAVCLLLSYKAARQRFAPFRKRSLAFTPPTAPGAGVSPNL